MINDLVATAEKIMENGTLPINPQDNKKLVQVILEKVGIEGLKDHKLFQGYEGKPLDLMIAYAEDPEMKAYDVRDYLTGLRKAKARAKAASRS